MKRFIAAVSFAVIAVPALAAGLPYDQNLADRALPNLPEKVLRTESSPAFGAPYEQNAVDRALPNIEPRRSRFAAASANDHNFISPAE